MWRKFPLSLTRTYFHQKLAILNSVAISNSAAKLSQSCRKVAAKLSQRCCKVVVLVVEKTKTTKQSEERDMFCILVVLCLDVNLNSIERRTISQPPLLWAFFALTLQLFNPSFGSKNKKFPIGNFWTLIRE